MKQKDLLLGLVVIVVWGLNFIAIKLGVKEIPPVLLGALRFLFTCVPAIFFLPRPPVSWPWLIALGIFLNVGQFAFLFLGVKVGMPAGLASLVMQSQVFFTLLVAVVWLGECWQWKHILGLAIAASGMVMIGSQTGGDMTLSGFLLVLAAAACWGTGNVLMRRATLGVPPFSALSLVVWAGAVAIIPLFLLSLLTEGWASWQQAFRDVTWQGFASLAYLAYLATLVGYVLWGKLMALYPAAKVAPLALLVPIVGLSSSALLLGESLTIWQVAGAILVMAGLAVHVLGERFLPFTDRACE